MSNLDDAADLICDPNPNIREDRRYRLAADYASSWAAGELERHLDYPHSEENRELIKSIGELITLAMNKQHERTTRMLEERLERRLDAR